MSLLLLLRTAPVVVVPPPVIPPVEVGSYGGGGFFTLGVSASRRKSWERAITSALKKPTSRAVQPRKVRQPSKVTVEAAIRTLPFAPEIQEEIVRDWKLGRLPSLRAVAGITGFSTAARLGEVIPEHGTTATALEIPSPRSGFGVAYGDAVQNPTDEELMQMLLTV